MKLRILTGNNGNQQSFKSACMEVSREGALDGVSYKKSQNKIIVCLSITSAWSSQLNNVVSCQSFKLNLCPRKLLQSKQSTK